MTCFVEALTVRTWCLSILPRLLWMRLRRGCRVSPCYVFDASRGGLRVARASQWLAWTEVEPLQFRLIDVRDEQGLLLRLRIAYQDLAEVQQEIVADPTFRQALSVELAQGRFPDYLAKAMAAISISERQTLWRALLTIQVCAWQMRKEGKTGWSAVYFMERRIWFKVIARYAATYGITAMSVPRSVNLAAWRRRFLTPELKRLLYRLQVHGMLGGRRIPVQQWATLANGRRGDPRARVAVEYYGHLNLDRPECYSDLFFWRQSGIPVCDVLMTFNHETHPLDEPKLAELTRHGIEAVAMRPKTVATLEGRVFVPRLWSDRPKITVPLGGLEGRWIKDQARTFFREARAFWSEFFEAEDVKVFVSWFKYTETHCAIADALKRVGGVATIYQRAYDSHPSAETAVMADVVFAFSPAVADLERRSHSRIPYLVVTGYLSDHRFPLLREQASRIRAKLEQHGAQRIVAFADENFHLDERWHTGPSIEWEAYRFLLEQVLANPWLGLVLKPKTPVTLRRRLGPVAELLARAEATGRCVVFEEGLIQGSYPPAAAALAADLMIHGHLNAATAGIDAAMAGVPTLLLDRAGWAISPLYRLGVGRVVFTDWETLWKTCLEHWHRPGGIPGFGDWSPVLDELDPFRDGRAAERMGTYIRWLLEGFRTGLDRDTVMADAAERYAARWGKETITHINPSLSVPDTGQAPAVEVGEMADITT